MKTFGSVVLAALVVVGFVGFLATHTIHANLATDAYFDKVLASSRLYDRLYDELLNDATFAPQIDALLGGIDVKREDAVAAVKRVVKPEYLEAAGKLLVKHLVAHLDNKAGLDLSIDITPIVERIHDVALELAAEGLAKLPVKQAASFDEFAVEFNNILLLMQGQGTIPSALPTYPLDAEQQRQVAAILVQAGGLDDSDPAQAKTVAAINQAVAASDVGRAIRVSADALLAKLIAQSIAILTDNEYVTRDGGRYLLHPGEETTKKIQSKLAVIQNINQAAGWGQIASFVAIVVALGLLVVIHRHDPRRRLGWPGGALLAAGTLGFVGWLIVRPKAASALAEVAERKQNLPPALRDILADVLNKSVGGLTPTIWIPSVAVAGAGIVLIGFAMGARKP